MTSAQAMTAEEALNRAISEGAAFTVDRETPMFVGVRFHLKGQPRHTVVRLHRVEYADVLSRLFH